MRLSSIVSALVLAVSMVSATAVARAESLAEIRQQQTQIQEELARGELVLDARSKRTVEAQQRIVFRLIEGRVEVGELTPPKQVELRNALEKIRAAVSQDALAEADREVCWQERRTGSKLTTTVCGTVRERQQAKEGARDYLQRPRICAPPGCGASP